MKTTSILLSLASLLFPTLESRAALVVTNLNLTPTSFSVEVSGSVPIGAPESPHTLFFENPNLQATPGFVIVEDFEVPNIIGFSGLQTLIDSIGVLTGYFEYGDYVWVTFDAPLVPGELVEGVVSATWENPVFDPSAVSTLEVHWGNLSTIPEPSSAVLVCLGALLSGAICRTRRG